MASSSDLLGGRLAEVLDAIASPASTPAAGSVAALTVGMAAALLEKAADASRDCWREAAGASAQAEALRLRAGPLAQAVARAYEDALAALTAPRETESEAGDAALGDVLGRAADVPLEIAAAASDTVFLGALVAERGDASVRADAVAATILAEAAARAATHLVEINLTTLQEDPRLHVARSALDEAARTVAGLTRPA